MNLIKSHKTRAETKLDDQVCMLFLSSGNVNKLNEVLPMFEKTADYTELFVEFIFLRIVMGL